MCLQPVAWAQQWAITSGCFSRIDVMMTEVMVIFLVSLPPEALSSVFGSFSFRFGATALKRFMDVRCSGLSMSGHLDGTAAYALSSQRTTGSVRGALSFSATTRVEMTMHAAAA